MIMPAADLQFSRLSPAGEDQDDAALEREGAGGGTGRLSGGAARRES